jgi:lysophospholipase L1-like esterase
MKTRIAALGDSLTKGVVLTDRNRYSVLDNNYMDIVGRELDLHVENYGKFGCTASFGSSVIDRHSDEIAESEYTFIEYGGNDCDFDWLSIAQAPEEQHNPKTSLDCFKRQIRQIVERVQTLGSKPILVSLPPILSNLYFSFFSKGMSEDQKSNICTWLGGDT